MALIQLSAISKVFVADEIETHALSDIHLNIEKANTSALADHPAVVSRRCCPCLDC
jgi:hypothetical protein